MSGVMVLPVTVSTPSPRTVTETVRSSFAASVGRMCMGLGALPARSRHVSGSSVCIHMDSLGIRAREDSGITLFCSGLFYVGNEDQRREGAFTRRWRLRVTDLSRRTGFRASRAPCSRVCRANEATLGISGGGSAVSVVGTWTRLLELKLELLHVRLHAA